jgi:peptidoglycan hydrolase-like protein with peptidoglycan-binding domain
MTFTGLTSIRRIFCLLSIWAMGLSACTPLTPNVAQRAAQPKVPAARNFTSFSASLRCMDDLLAGAKRPRVLISSTGIPDLTNKLYVGADDMLLNAINQMNRKSKSYLFIDQSLEKEVGQIAIYTPKKTDTNPKLYIRGAISQIDSSVASSSLKLDAEHIGSGNSDQIGTADNTIGRGLTVVTVDMHLVAWPSKTVIPGSSVANSMVVTSRSFGLGASGTIDVTALDAALTITRVESLGQAVRNLVELGAIELIGRHANVPYWECLNIPAVKQRRTNRKEIVFSSADKPFRIPEVQKMMIQLGYYSGDVTGVVDQRTRDSISHFQASHGLIATGDLNYDTYQHLLEKTKGFQLRRRTAPPPKPMPTQIITTPQNIVPEPMMEAPAGKSAGRVFGSRKATSLNLKSMKRRYRVGDIWQTYVVLPRAGFLSCFHQSDNGAITQILPTKPNAAFSAGEGQEILLPDPSENFDIKFEKKGAREKILCILEVTQKPTSISDIGSKEALSPMRVKSFEDIIKTYRARNKNILWGQIQERG